MRARVPVERVTGSQMAQYRVAPSVGTDKGQQATLQSEHATIDEAFAALDAIRAQMARTGAPSDAIELIVADDDGWQVPQRQPLSE